MDEPLPISVFIISRNEAARLDRTFRALAFADDIVLVDSGSTDGTQAIAARHGARVLHHDWRGYGPQKAFAERACHHPWRLNVDADEEVTPQLRDEIAAVVQANTPPTAFTIAILNVYPGETAPRPFANDYRVVRFYHRDAGAYRDHPLFDRVEVRPGIPVEALRGPIHHHPFVSWEALATKLNSYTSYSAKEGRLRSRTVLLLRLPLEFPAVFLKSYILRRHIFGGWKGFSFAVVQAFFRTLRIVKLLERHEAAANASEREGQAASEPSPPASSHEKAR